ncbi:MAG: LysE family translocator [Cohaesibacter sp.]|jgi:threonine/homoserine/homoserine lactone efflux protein|nr:LysE family translocator [Cohaesibacter sp.]
MSVEFFVTCFFIVITPGTGMIYTLACAIGAGGRGAFWGALGSTLSIVPHIIAAALGVAAILHASAVAFQVVKILGVAYLLYMAWGIIRDKSLLSVDDGCGTERHGRLQVSSSRLVWNGILASLLNPKLSVFFLAFLPQFVSVDTASPMAEMLMLGGVFMAMTFVVFVLVGLVASSVRNHVLSSPSILAWLKRTFAATFVALGVRLALVEQS